MELGDAIYFNDSMCLCFRLFDYGPTNTLYSWVKGKNLAIK